MSYTDAIAEAYASAPIDELALDTLELYHPAFIDDQGLPTAVYVVLGYDDWELKLPADAILNANKKVKFLGCAFEFTLSEVSDDTIPQIQLSIKNANRQMSRYLELAAYSEKVIQVTYRPYLASDPDTVQLDPCPTFDLSDVTLDAFSAKGVASLQDVHNMPFPSEKYTPNRFGGLRR